MQSPSVSPACRAGTAYGAKNCLSVFYRVPRTQDREPVTSLINELPLSEGLLWRVTIKLSTLTSQIFFHRLTPGVFIRLPHAFTHTWLMRSRISSLSSVHGILSQRINSAVGPYLRVYTNPGLPDCRQAGGHYRPPCEIKAKLLLQLSISQGATLGFVMNRFTAFRRMKGMVFQITMQFRRLFKALLNPRHKYRGNR